MDALSTLRRLRRASLDDAQRTLGRALAVEARAESHVAELDRAIAHETGVATAAAGDDASVEAFGRWLAQARRRSATHRAALEAAQAETHRSRAALTACRAALESVETLQRERRATSVAGTGRIQQHDLDDIARRTRDATWDSNAG